MIDNRPDSVKFQPPVRGSYKFKNVNMEDPLVWNLFCGGNVKGLFQVETPLGQSWCKKIKPKNIDELSALISLIRPGGLQCLASGSRVMCGSYFCKTSNKNRPIYKNIEDLYQQYLNLKEKEPNHKPSNGLVISSYDENSQQIIKNKIAEVFKCGKKTVYDVVIKYRYSRRKDNTSTKILRGYKLESTLEHKFLTLERGWQTLQDLIPGEYIIVSNRSIIRDSKGKNHTPRKKHIDFKEICYYNYKHKCLFCDWKEGSLDTNHIVGNRFTNNNPDNLCFLCPNHHRLYSERKISKQALLEKMGSLKLINNEDVRCVQFLDKKLVGEKETYDISVYGPNHNYIAGNFIVHNSGQAEKYAKIKNGEEEPFYIHEALRPILGKTYSCLIFQEQILEICVKIAGFSEVEADLARRAVGKKLPEEMMKVEKMFLEGCKKKAIVPDNIAKEIFSWIQKSVAYLFNAGHSYSYAYTGFFQAVQKKYFPVEFYTASLAYSSEKIDPKIEIYELVQDAKRNNIGVLPPDIRIKNEDFQITKDNKIVFGLSHIRGVGGASIKNLNEKTGELNDFPTFLTNAKKIKKNVAEALIKSGACDCYKLSRSYMLKVLHAILGRSDNEDGLPEYRALTNNEYKPFLKKYEETNNLQESLQFIIDTESCIKKRIPVIEAKIAVVNNDNIIDTNKQKSLWEKIYLGLNLTCSAADDIAKIEKDVKTCKEIFKTPAKSKVVLHVVIDNVKHKVTGEKSKNPGAKYCYMTVSDNSASCEVICWPDTFDKFKDGLIEDTVVCLYCYKDNWGGREQMIVRDLEVVG